MWSVEAVEPWAMLRIRQMRETTESLTAANDIPNLLPRILERVRDVLGAEVPAIVLLDEDGGLAHVALPQGDHYQAVAAFIPESETLRSVWSHEQAVRSDALSRVPTAAPEPVLGPFVGAPIRLSGRAMGAVFGFRSSGAEPFSTLDELAVVTLALQTAAHVSRVTSREHLQRIVLLEERHRIAAELHAGIVDELRALAREALAPGDGSTPGEDEALGALGARLLSLADGVDDYSAALSSAPRALSGDLSSDLATLLRQAVPDGVDTILRVNLGGLAPSARLAEDIVFIVREAVTNSVRHGSPSKIAVDLRESGGSLVLAVQDDGIGLDVDHRRPGIGLLALQNRVERSAGVLNLVGLPGMGTLVYVTFSPESRAVTRSG